MSSGNVNCQTQPNTGETLVKQAITLQAAGQVGMLSCLLEDMFLFEHRPLCELQKYVWILIFSKDQNNFFSVTL